MLAKGEGSADGDDDWGGSLFSVSIGSFGEVPCLVDPKLILSKGEPLKDDEDEELAYCAGSPTACSA